MADAADPSRLPQWNAAALPTPDNSPQAAHSTPAVQPQKKGKSNRRNGKSNSTVQQPRPLDGSVSDSVAATTPALRSKKGHGQGAKPRQQSEAITAPPRPNAQQAKASGQKQRPVSMGGNMLPATPMKEQAYAGPTFQASPAPSSLPVPKFFASRSVPNVAVAQHSRSLDARVAGQKTPEKEQVSPETDVASPEPPSRATQQSPLDLFFNAQKAENERKGSLRSPEMHTRQVPPATEPRNPFQQSGKSVFLREMDGDGDEMPSPKTLPPQRSSRDRYTQSLKDLLFNAPPPGPQQQPHATPPQHQRSASNLQSPPQQHSTPSSGPSTPTEHQNQYSLHYGNRNLSPLFKASRGDTPPRPSNLRQNSSASDSSPAANYHPQYRQSQQIDPNSFSRNYLDQHIRASQPATMPQLPGMTNGAHESGLQHNTTNGTHGTSASPRTTTAGPRDIRAMEDDLRRMLKVNVLGN